jgi:hypothetical protein
MFPALAAKNIAQSRSRLMKRALEKFSPEMTMSSGKNIDIYEKGRMY